MLIAERGAAITIAVVFSSLMAPAFAADIVLTPPAAGGVAISDADNTVTRFRVGDDGAVTIPGLSAVSGTFTGLCIEAATGRVGTCSVGAIINIATGPGLSGGPITSSGTISIANGGVGTTQLADGAITTAKLADGAVSFAKLGATGCASGQVLKFSGAAWACAEDNVSVSTGPVTEVTASLPLISTGGSTPNISLSGGAAGEVLAGTGGSPAWTGSPTLNGNLTLAAASSALAGTIMKGAAPFIHNFGTRNTFVGIDAGNLTMSGDANTSLGSQSLSGLTTGKQNTALGVESLASTSTGSANTAVGETALLSNQTGGLNAAFGAYSLRSNVSDANSGFGASTLRANTTGFFNTALGYASMIENISGTRNTTAGAESLQNNTTGNLNISIGYRAGFNLTTGDYNIAIGNQAEAGESATTRIGDSNQNRTFISGIRSVTTSAADALPVLIDSNGQLGTVSSSGALKQEIVAMGDLSAALMKLRPVTFRYRQHGPTSRLQYGLIAEEVDEIYPELVVRTADGRIETVMYQFLPPMLLNEYQRQQRTISEQSRLISEQAAKLERQSVRTAQLERDREIQLTRIRALEEQSLELVSLRAETARLAALLDRLANPSLRSASR